NKFQTIYTLKQELSLDEGDNLILWRGRLSFRTYNSAKLTKYGILVVCEATSVYILKYIQAQGKNYRKGIKWTKKAVLYFLMLLFVTRISSPEKIK
ncbi:hypothetical protein WN51_06539, partial [Melipona quadrifasciata]